MNNNNFFCASILVMLGFVFVFNPAQAGIYKCISQKGSVYYNDKPCPKRDKEIRMKAVKDPKSRYIPKSFVKDRKNIKPTKGIVVGKDSIKEKAKNRTNKRKNENLSGDSMSKKTLGSTINRDSVSASASSLSTMKTESNNTRIPTVEEDLKAVLGRAATQKNAIKKYLSKMVQ